jgi:hypothetical protein
MSLDYKPGKIHVGSWGYPHIDPVIEIDGKKIPLKHGQSNAETIRLEIAYAAYDAGLHRDSFVREVLHDILKK